MTSNASSPRKRIRCKGQLCRAELLYIKMLLRAPRGERHSRKEIADFFNLSTKTVRDIEKSRGPRITQWELERLGLERWGYDNRKLRTRSSPLPIDGAGTFAEELSYGERQKEMYRLYHEENMPIGNIGVRFGLSNTSVRNAIEAYGERLSKLNEEGRL